MNITPEERENAVNIILNKGLKRPVSTWTYLNEMYRCLGLRHIFWEALPALLISFVFVFFCSFIFFTQLDHLVGNLNIYTTVFMLSPILFIGLTVSTEAIERFSGLFDLKMTGKYTIRQISAFRILCFTLVGTVFTVIVSVIIATNIEQIHLFNLLSLALASIFLCSLLIIHSIRRWRGGWYIGTIIWTTVCVLLMIFVENEFSLFLANISPIITLTVSTIAIILYLREIKITSAAWHEYSHAALRR
ncbi:MAG: hypothetical protein LBC71_05210 [Oscillospiraceae bacterium]|jgi:hypothetical protein|nr:hypothetical protein [Oscillospiraceae bacterium]